MDKRLGFVGIVLERQGSSVQKVNEVLSAHGSLIMARMGVPHAAGEEGVITLVVKATTDEVGGLTGRLGMLPGVTVKSALTKGGARQ